jgi:hypothetical protein
VYANWFPKLRSPKKITRPQNLQNGFLACGIDHTKPDTAFLNVNEILGGVALAKDGFFGPKLRNLFSQTVRFEKHLNI